MWSFVWGFCSFFSWVSTRSNCLNSNVLISIEYILYIWYAMKLEKNWILFFFVFFLDQWICLFNKPVYLIIRLSSTGRYYINTVYMFYASFCLFSFVEYRKLGFLASGYFGGFLSKCGCLILVCLIFGAFQNMIVLFWCFSNG